MNKEQQELYEKLLKKVNEYCLGAAAEDVIAAIDDLVDTYESRLTEADGYATRYSEALEIIKKKGANIRLLKETDTVIEYNELIKSHYGMLPLNQEEYQLVKEIIKHE